MVPQNGGHHQTGIEFGDGGCNQLHPPKFKNMYRSWMENVRDWCIKTAVVGASIPAFYLQWRICSSQN